MIPNTLGSISSVTEGEEYRIEFAGPRAALDMGDGENRWKARDALGRYERIRIRTNARAAHRGVGFRKSVKSSEGLRWKYAKSSGKWPPICWTRKPAY